MKTIFLILIFPLFFKNLRAKNGVAWDFNDNIYGIVIVLAVTIGISVKIYFKYFYINEINLSSISDLLRYCSVNLDFLFELENENQLTYSIMKSESLYILLTNLVKIIPSPIFFEHGMVIHEKIEFYNLFEKLKHIENYEEFKNLRLNRTVLFKFLIALKANIFLIQ